MITQKVDFNDPVLGFAHSWVKKISERVDFLYVICNGDGYYDLPNNVRVYSLGKEKGGSRMKRFLRFQYLLFRILPKIDGVFIHMCPIYFLAGIIFFKMFRKKVVLWYIHVRRKNPKLWLAQKLASSIMTAAPEGVPLGEKVRIVGHGIDADRFSFPKAATRRKRGSVLFLGRISSVKNIEILIDAFAKLLEEFPKTNLSIVGGAESAEDFEYLALLKERVRISGIGKSLIFHGPVANYDAPKFFQNADIAVNLTKTGGFDKAILEAMACGALPLVSSRSYRAIFSQNLQHYLMFREDDPNDLRKKLIGLIRLDKDAADNIRKMARDIVVRHHNLNNLSRKIIKEFSK